MSGFELAQVNISRLQFALDGPEMRDFMAALDNINALAERSPGFVWRLKGDGNNATDIDFPGGQDIIVNMSTWADVDALRGFVYKTAHAAVMARRAKWFPRLATADHALWWVAAGHRPTLEEAADRLARVDARGWSPEAFTFDEPYGSDGLPLSLPPIIKDCA